MVAWLRAADRGVAAAAGGGGRATSWGARVACARYLQSRRDFVSGPIACLGLSGGGCRAALLHAACEEMAGAGVMGMMTTHPALLDRPVDKHTWMFFARVGEPRGLARRRCGPRARATPGAIQPRRPARHAAGHERRSQPPDHSIPASGCTRPLRRRVLRRHAQVRHRNAAVRLAHLEQWLRK